MVKAFTVAKTGDDDEAAEEVASVGYVPDLLSEMKLLQYAGIGFGEIETYRL